VSSGTLNLAQPTVWPSLTSRCVTWSPAEEGYARSTVLQSVVPESFNVAQSTTRKETQQQKLGGSRTGIRRCNSYTNTRKPLSSLSMTPVSRSSIGGHASTPTVPNPAEESVFYSAACPDVSAIGPAPVLSKLLYIQQ